MTLEEAIGSRLHSIFEIKELKKRILFTLGMFLIARIGIHIAVPGLDMQAFKNFQNNSAGGFLNLFSGGAIQRASIFSLGIIPYINASIIFQLIGVVVPKIDEMQKEGGKEKEKITQWTRYLTIIIAILQSIGIIVLLESQGLVIEPGMMFNIQTITLITGGTAFLMWVAERISIRGIGNGTSMLIFLNIVSGLPQVIYQMAKNLPGGLGMILFIVSLILFIGLIALMVLIQLAERRIPIQYVGKGRAAGGTSTVGQRTFLPLKINMSGVMPIIFASVLMSAPAFLVGLMKSSALKNILTKGFSQTGWMYLLLFAVLVIIFSFFYTSIVFDPEKVSENLKQSGATIPQIRPGADTADYLEGVATRITFGSALFLAILGVFPNIWFGYVLNMQVLLGGTSLLILVGVAVDLLQQIDSQSAVKSYKGFISK